VFDIINTTEVLDGVKARHALFMEGLKAINGRRRVFRDLRGEGRVARLRARHALEGQGRWTSCARPERPGSCSSWPGPTSCASRRRSVISLDEILEGLARLETALNRALT
jgi:acetylornithine/N-succinyldiaminopimelate aminotransferase